MSNHFSLIVAAALVNNLVFIQLLGVSLIFTSGGRLGRSLELAVMTSLVLVTSTVVNKLIFEFILEPLGFEFLQLIVYVSSATLLSSFLTVLVREKFPLSYRQHVSLFFFAGANSAVIGSALLNASTDYSILQTFSSALGSALGFTLVMLSLTAMTLRLSMADAPLPFRGGPLLLISAGLAAMSFLGFAGLV